MTLTSMATLAADDVEARLGHEAEPARGHRSDVARRLRGRPGQRASRDRDARERRIEDVARAAVNRRRCDESSNIARV